MKRFMLFIVTAAVMCAVSCDELGNLGLKPDDGDEVEVSFTFSLPANEGTDMAKTKSADSEIFAQFYKKIADGTLTAPSFELKLVEKEKGDEYTLKGKWVDNETYTLACGTYSLKGFSTAEGSHVQEKCSIVFDEEITVEEGTKSIRLTAGYDAALLVFNDPKIAEISNFDGNNEKDELFKFGDYFYAFVNGMLYDEGMKDKAYLFGTSTDGKEFSLKSGDREFEKGKYYVYSDILSDEGALEGDFKLDFDIPEMGDGKDDETPGGSGADMKLNRAWTVSYLESAEVYGEITDDVISVTSSDNNVYFITVIDRETFETYDIKENAQYELDYLKEWVAMVEEEYQLGFTLQDFLYQGDAMESFTLVPGEYYGLAFGVNDKEELSGFYAVSNLFTVEGGGNAGASGSYSSWLGNWTWTGSNGVSFDVTFEQDVENESYLMYGWEGEYDSQLAVPVYWYPEDEMWAIFTTDFGTFEFEGGEQANIYIMPEDAEGYVYPVVDEPICIGGYAADGAMCCISYDYEEEDGSSVSFVDMLYLAEFSDGYYLISDTEAWPSFPIVITPAQETKSAAKVKRKAGFHAKNSAPLKLFYPTVKKTAVR